MRPLLFIDFDGTLCHDKFWRSLDADTANKIENFLFREDTTLVNEWMRGKYTSEQINQMMADKFGFEYEKLWGVFVKDCETMSISQDVLNKIRGLRAKYTVVLATSNMDCFERFTVPALKLHDYFDGVESTHTSGFLKDDPSGKFFTALAEKYGLSLKGAMLIDNSMRTCRLFETLGGSAKLVTTDNNLLYWLEQIK